MTRRPDFAAALSIAAPVDSYLDAALPPAPAAPVPQRLAVDLIRPSPYQPVGRPSDTALGAVRAILPELLASANAPDNGEREKPADLLRGLDAEAQALAELTLDAAIRRADGLDPIEKALEIRETPSGYELIAGHRRLAAARLLALGEVAVRSLGMLSDTDAAVAVFRDNRLRKDFTAWQEARSLAAFKAQRGETASVRTLARQMGYSLGRASELLSMADKIAPLLPVLGNGDPLAGEALIANLPYQELRRVIAAPEIARVTLLQHAIGPRMKPPSAKTPPVPRTGHEVAEVYSYAIKRGGASTLTVHQALDALSPDGARQLIAFYQDQIKQLRATLANPTQ